MASSSQTSKKSRLSYRNREAWHWVRGLADSMIVMAAALTVIGVDLKPYFEAKARISILKMEAELKVKQPQNDNAIIDQSLINQVNENTLIIEVLLEDTHKAGEK